MERFGYDIPHGKCIGGDYYRTLALYYDGRLQRKRSVNNSIPSEEWGKQQVELLKHECGSQQIYERIYPLKEFEVREYTD